MGLDAKPVVAFVIIGIIYGERESDMFDETKSEQHVRRSVNSFPVISPRSLLQSLCNYVCITYICTVFVYLSASMHFGNECNKHCWLRWAALATVNCLWEPPHVSCFIGGKKASEICKTKSSHRCRPKAAYEQGKCQNVLSAVQAIKRRLLGCMLWFSIDIRAFVRKYYNFASHGFKRSQILQAVI